MSEQQFLRQLEHQLKTAKRMEASFSRQSIDAISILLAIYKAEKIMLG